MSKILFGRNELISHCGKKKAHAIMQRLASVVDVKKVQMKNPYRVLNMFDIDEVISYYSKKSKNPNVQKLRDVNLEVIIGLKKTLQRRSKNED